MTLLNNTRRPCWHHLLLPVMMVLTTGTTAVLVQGGEEEETGSLQCNGVNALGITNSEITLGSLSPTAGSGIASFSKTGTIELDTPVYTDAPRCNGAYTNDAAPGFWFSIPANPTTREETRYMTFNFCMGETLDDGRFEGISGFTVPRVNIFLYSDMILRGDHNSDDGLPRRSSNTTTTTCADLTCLPTQDFYIPPSLPSSCSPSILESPVLDAVGASTKLELHPSLDYFVFVNFKSLQHLPTNISYNLQVSTGGIINNSPPPANNVKENAQEIGPTAMQSRGSSRTVDGTLSGATMDVIPSLCELKSNRNNNNATWGVWYKVEFENVDQIAEQEEVFSVNICDYDSDSWPKNYVALYYGDASSSSQLRCAQNPNKDMFMIEEPICVQEIIPTESLLYIYVYAFTPDDAEKYADFTLSVRSLSSPISSADLSFSSMMTSLLLVGGGTATAILSTTMLGAFF